MVGRKELALDLFNEAVTHSKDFLKRIPEQNVVYFLNFIEYNCKIVRKNITITSELQRNSEF